MKTVSLFELGYLDLFKAIFLGKKIRLVPDTRIVKGAHSTEGPQPGSSAGASTVTDYHVNHNFDPFNPNPFERLNWNAGKNWLDPYHVNPFTPNPFDRH